MKLNIQALIRDGKGYIVGYELDSGSIIDNEQAVYMIDRGEIENAYVVSRKKGHEEINCYNYDISTLQDLK